jgi:hypothetical protein
MPPHAVLLLDAVLPPDVALALDVALAPDAVRLCASQQVWEELPVEALPRYVSAAHSAPRLPDASCSPAAVRPLCWRQSADEARYASASHCAPLLPDARHCFPAVELRCQPWLRQEEL